MTHTKQPPRFPGQFNRDIKLHVPEALYDDLSALARMDRRALSEYIRVTLEQHVYGMISVYRG